MKLIGISGKMGSGKTTLVNMLRDKYENLKTFKFATSLYDLQDTIYNRLGLTLEGEKDRELLIQIGTWARSKDPNIFAKMGLAQVDDNIEVDLLGPIVNVFDDVRFHNEAQMILDRGGHLIRIEGVQRGPNLTEQHMKSSTECALDDFPFENVINNQGTVEDTYRQLTAILDKLK